MFCMMMFTFGRMKVMMMVAMSWWIIIRRCICMMVGRGHSMIVGSIWD